MSKSLAIIGRCSRKSIAAVGMDRASTDREPHHANPDSTLSIRHVLHPVVQITPADSVRRLGTG